MNYTRDLFAHLLARPPIGLPQEVVEKGNKALQQLEASNATEDDAEQALVAFGIEAWPYWQAEKEFLEQLGGKKYMFLQHLPKELHEKWVAFESGGGSMQNYRDGASFEEAFSAEENRQIESAMIEAHQSMITEAKKRAEADRKSTYAALVQEYKQRQQEMFAALDELAKIQKESPEWGNEIQDLIEYYRRGFAELEEIPTVKKIQGKIDWYRGHA